MKNTLLFILLFIGRGWDGFASDKVMLRIKPGEISNNSEYSELAPHFSEEMIKSLRDLPLTYNRYFQLIVHDEKIYAFSPCYLDIYRWEGEEWNNLYQFDNKGYTCGSRLFFYKNQFHLLGGYGFWNNHTDLLHFDQNSGSWSLEVNENQPVDYNTELIGIGETSGFMFLGIHHNPRLGIDNVYEDDGFMLDFESKTWNRLDFGGLISFSPGKAKFLIQQGRGVDTENFMVLNAFTSTDHKLGMLLFDKRTLELRFYRRDSPFDFFNFANWILVEGDQIKFSDNQNQIQTLDIADFYQKADFVGKAEVQPIAESSYFLENWEYIFLLISAVFAGTALVLFLGLKIFPSQTQTLLQKFRSKNIPEKEVLNDEKKEAIELWEKLLYLQGETLTTEQLDQVLEIDGIPNLDRKKVKRSRLIKAINKHSVAKWGYTLITKKRNPEDKRFMIYKVEKAL
ncbi:hypothetical protein [Algoriphagus limi]|uniref:Uncharacterized protein n=1 Tax=Algoriphagus limi TaxID=2975273 RepID=A0ABT2G249_9BACT|nr:hypothetical protein [Algoriphagus limi]MCS5489162.1 hypothetical protein [Algoriphagus limi]